MTGEHANNPQLMEITYEKNEGGLLEETITDTTEVVNLFTLADLNANVAVREQQIVDENARHDAELARLVAAKEEDEERLAQAIALGVDDEPEEPPE